MNEIIETTLNKVLDNSWSFTLLNTVLNKTDFMTEYQIDTFLGETFNLHIYGEHKLDFIEIISIEIKTPLYQKELFNFDYLKWHTWLTKQLNINSHSFKTFDENLECKRIFENNLGKIISQKKTDIGIAILIEINSLKKEWIIIHYDETSFKIINACFKKCNETYAYHYDISNKTNLTKLNKWVLLRWSLFERQGSYINCLPDPTDFILEHHKFCLN